MTDLDEQARDILRGNDKGRYTLPTHGLYPYQWNWDSVFAAWGFATFDLPRAWAELHTLLASQWEDGMVPHIIFHQDDPGYFPGPEVWNTGKTPPTSGITQPPVAAILIRKIWEMDQDLGHAHVKALYPKLLAWHRWWHEVRCSKGPAAIVHPWESGRDNSIDWDIGMADVDGSRVGAYDRRDLGHVASEMRPTKEDYDRYVALLQFGRGTGWDQRRIVEESPFLMGDPGISFILLRAHHDLALMGLALGEDVREIEGWAQALRKGVDQLWNDVLGVYDARNLRTGAFSGVLSIGSCLAYLAGVENAALEANILRAWDMTPHGLPTADPNVAQFNPRKYWRGPSWPVINALTAMGLVDRGRVDLAERLRAQTATLIQTHGFYEYYDPTDATPCGGSAFSWTAAIWLTWARHAPETEIKEGAA